MNRKTLLLFAAMLLTAVASWADSSAGIILSHAGKATPYKASELKTALLTAEEGDTLFLSAGQYAGFTLNKAITVRGVGYETKITGTVEIRLSNNLTLTEGVPLLEGLNVMNGSSLLVSAPCTNFLVRFCHFDNFTCNINGMNNAMIDRCDIGTFNISEYMTDFYVRNTYIDNLSSTNTAYHNQCNFINCDIYNVSTGSGHFNDCVFFSGTIYSSLLCRCLTMKDAGVHSSSACDKVEHTTSTTWVNTEAFVDGVRIGYLAGNTPYVSHYRPYGPKEDSKNFSVVVDDGKKTIDATIYMEPN